MKVFGTKVEKLSEYMEREFVNNLNQAQDLAVLLDGCEGKIEVLCNDNGSSDIFITLNDTKFKVSEDHGGKLNAFVMGSHNLPYPSYVRSSKAQEAYKSYTFDKLNTKRLLKALEVEKAYYEERLEWKHEDDKNNNANNSKALARLEFIAKITKTKVAKTVSNSVLTYKISQYNGTMFNNAWFKVINNELQSTYEMDKIYKICVVINNANNLI